MVKNEGINKILQGNANKREASMALVTSDKAEFAALTVNGAEANIM